MTNSILFETPIGHIELIELNNKLTSVRFVESPALYTTSNNQFLNFCKDQFVEYFKGTRNAFEIPLSINGSPFQTKVWNELLKISKGETITYGDLANSLGMKHGARAVGTACGSNPLLLVIPCHRVVGANQKLTGYEGGLHRKKWLLEHEGVLCRSIF